MHAKFWLALVAVAVGLGAGGVALAADAPAQDQAKQDMVKQALAKDAVCTKCHDENDNKAILSIYQTKHGVKADSRTPGCQTCHGASDAHVKNPQGTRVRPSPDVVFGAEVDDAGRREERRLPAVPQVGRPDVLDRQQAPVPRRRLRELPPGARAARPGARQDHAARRLLRLPQDAARADPPDLDAPDPRRQGRLLRLPQSARLDRRRS